MKTLFAIVGGIVILGGAGAGFYYLVYLPGVRKITYNKIDYLAKSIDWQTHFATGSVGIDELKKWPDETMGISKGVDDLKIKRMNDNCIRFTLSRDGKLIQQDDIDFVKRNVPA